MNGFDRVLFIGAKDVIESIVVIDITRSAKAKKHVQECVDGNLCCNCKTNSMWKNGVCRKCHYRIACITADLPKQKREVFRGRLIRLGKMLMPQEIRKWKSRDDIAAIAEEVSR